MLVNTCSYNGGACLIIYICACAEVKKEGAFQIKLALDTVHFHALQQRCARINEAV